MLQWINIHKKNYTNLKQNAMDFLFSLTWRKLCHLLLFKYPLKEFFEYTIPYENLPLTGLDFEIRIHKNTKVYLDCIEQSEEKKVLTYNQLNSKVVSSSPAGVTVFCTDRREKVEDSLGVLVYSTGKGFKSFNGTQLSKLLI